MPRETKVKLTAFLWDWLFRNLAGFDLPEKMGGGITYDRTQRAIVAQEVQSAVKTLKQHSPFAQIVGPKNAIRFGEVKDWEEKPSATADAKPTWEHVAHERVYEVTLGDDAVSGILWMMQVLLTPAVLVPQHVQSGQGAKEIEVLSHISLNPYQADRYAWPVVEALRKTRALREVLGLGAAKGRRWGDDDESADLPPPAGEVKA